MAGGSQISITKTGITITTNGKIIYQAKQHELNGPASLERGIDLKGFPSHEPYNEKFKLVLPSGEAMTNIAYEISNNERSYVALTDNDGLSEQIHTDAEQELEIGVQWMSLEKEEDSEQE